MYKMNENDQIPKIIHYCWFGEKPLPEREQKCMKSWKKVLPDYQFMFWNEETFDINSTEWTRTAYEAKKYAFVSDYVRLWALNNYGGVYLDTDVRMLKSFTPLLNQRMFWCFEDAGGEIVASCTFASVAEDEFLFELLKYYEKPFSMELVDTNEANTVMITKCLQKRGLQLDGTEQNLNGIHVYPRDYFCPIDFWGDWHQTKNTYSVHYFSASWLPEQANKKHRIRTTWVFRIAKKIYGKAKDVFGKL